MPGGLRATVCIFLDKLAWMAVVPLASLDTFLGRQDGQPKCSGAFPSGSIVLRPVSTRKVLSTKAGQLQQVSGLVGLQ